MRKSGRSHQSSGNLGNLKGLSGLSRGPSYLTRVVPNFRAQNCWQQHLSPSHTCLIATPSGAPPHCCSHTRVDKGTACGLGGLNEMLFPATLTFAKEILVTNSTSEYSNTVQLPCDIVYCLQNQAFCPLPLWHPRFDEIQMSVFGV